MISMFVITNTDDFFLIVVSLQEVSRVPFKSDIAHFAWRVTWNYTNSPFVYLSDMIELGTGSRSTFEFTSRVNLFGPSLYSIARTFG